MKRSVLVLASLALLLWGGSWDDRLRRGGIRRRDHLARPCPIDSCVPWRANIIQREQILQQ